MKNIGRINFVRRMVLALTLAISGAEAAGAIDDYVDDFVDDWRGEVLGEGRTKDDFGADLYLLLSDMPVRYFSKKTIDGAYYQFKLGFPYSESVEPPDEISGYRFTKWRVVWREDDDDAPIYLYASWEKALDFVVRFNANDGHPCDPFSQRRIYPATGEMLDQEFSYGVAQNLNKCAFTRAGYTFRGWKEFTDFKVRYGDCESINLSESDVSSDIYDLYAVWEANTISITFDFRGFTPGDNYTITHKVGESFDQGKWSFVDGGAGVNVDGWFTADGREVRYTDYVPTESTTLYLHWQRKEYTVKFDPNGGSGKMASKKFQYGIATALPANQFVCSGCRFKGWSTTAGGEVEFTDGQQIKKIKSMAGLSSLTVRLYAVWEPVARPVKVVFDPMGGTADYTEWTYEIGKPYGRLPNVTHNGYTFKCWRTQSNGGSVVDVNTSAAASVTKLYAWLVPVSYAIDYCETKGAANPNPTSYDIEDEIVFSPLPNVTGYTFVRWEPSMISRGSTGDRTVTAIWSVATYSIVYKPGRLGQGDEVRASKTHGEPLTLKGALYTREGCRQIGWTIHEEGQKEYKLRGTCDVNADLTLYPAWEPLPTYTITYEPGYYGSGEPVVERYYVGDSATLRGALFTREGGAQTGWTKVEGEFKEYDFGETYTQQEDLTLYPVWTAFCTADLSYGISGGKVWITGYNGSGGDIVIPSEIEGKTVVGIERSAFSGKSAITSVLLPPSITTIRESAFRGCSKLTAINLPEGLAAIEKYTFYECKHLKSIDIPQGVTLIDERAFYYCTGLVSVKIPAGVKTIGGYAFGYCRRLEEIVMQEGLERLLSSAFEYCSALRSVVIPGSICNMENYVFQDCVELTDVRIGEGLREVGDWMFLRCTSLKSLVLPTSIVTVGCNMFRDCSVLERVVFLGSRPAIRDDGYWATLSANKDCLVYAIDGMDGWGFLPTTWDGHTVKGHQLNFPCTIMFDPNGGTGRMDDLVCESGEKVYKLPPCTFTPPAGKKRFAGWRSMLGKRYDDGMLVFGLRSLGGIVMMTAIWE